MVIPRNVPSTNVFSATKIAVALSLRQWLVGPDELRDCSPLLFVRMHS